MNLSKIGGYNGSSDKPWPIILGWLLIIHIDVFKHSITCHNHIDDGMNWKLKGRLITSKTESNKIKKMWSWLDKIRLN